MITITCNIENGFDLKFHLNEMQMRRRHNQQKHCKCINNATASKKPVAFYICVFSRSNHFDACFIIYAFLLHISSGIVCDEYGTEI